MRIHEVFIAGEEFEFNLCMVYLLPKCSKILIASKITNQVMPRLPTNLSKAIKGSHLKRKQKLRVSRGQRSSVSISLSYPPIIVS